jgi:hypothetical protein
MLQLWECSTGRWGCVAQGKATSYCCCIQLENKHFVSAFMLLLGILPKLWGHLIQGDTTGCDSCRHLAIRPQARNGTSLCLVLVARLTDVLLPPMQMCRHNLRNVSPCVTVPLPLAPKQHYWCVVLTATHMYVFAHVPHTVRHLLRKVCLLFYT